MGEILGEFIFTYFGIELEDKSDKQVSEDVLKLHSEIFREEKLTFYNELEKFAALFKSEFSVEWPITKQSVQKKMMINKEKKELEGDDDSEGSWEECEDEDVDIKEEKKNNNVNVNVENVNVDSKNLSKVDDDGFSTVLKTKGNKKEKKIFDNNDVDMIIIDDNVNVKVDDKMVEDDGFVEVKKKKGKK